MPDKGEGDELLLEEFAYSLAEIAQRVCNASESEPVFDARFDGILILIDEADNASEALALGSFAKLLTERLQRRGCSRILFGLAGLPELRQVLRDSHPSSLRVFEELPLERLSDSEVSQAIDICLRKANQLNGEEITISDEGRKALIQLAEGYPHFIQQFGYSAFEENEDEEIGFDDVIGSAFGNRGALEIIGDRYYRDDFYNKIGNESYRQVLRIMSDKLDQWVQKKEIKARYKGNEKTLDNAIQALRDRKIILSKEGERGVYRLQDRGFALWIKLYTTDPSAQKTLLQEGLAAAAESVSSDARKAEPTK